MKFTLAMTMFVAVSALPCQAGYMIKSTTTHLQTGKSDENAMLLDGKNLRTTAVSGYEVDMIFRGDENKVWQIMKDKRQVMEMTEEISDAMATQMDAAMQEMQKRLASMPPAQRAMMEKMLEEKMPKKEEAAPEFAYRVEKTGNTREIDGIQCHQYDIFLDEEKASEMFVASWNDVGADKDALEALVALSSFMQKFMKKMNSFAASKLASFPDLNQLDGYPLLMRTFKDGVAETEARWALPEEQDVSATTFELPPGYKVVNPMAAAAGL